MMRAPKTYSWMECQPAALSAIVVARQVPSRIIVHVHARCSRHCKREETRAQLKPSLVHACWGWHRRRRTDAGKQLYCVRRAPEFCL